MGRRIRPAFVRRIACAVSLGFATAAFANALVVGVGRAQEVAGRGAREEAQRVREGQQSARPAEGYAELPNFRRVDGHLYRGAQPRERGLERLAAMGVKTVINLRGDDGRARDEEREARALGLRYFNVPVSRAGRPSFERIEELMRIVDAPENQPVFVHCKRGADRTGAFVAAYRITHDGWTGEQALAEAERFGLGFWQHGKRDFIRDFYRDHAPPQPSKPPETQSKTTH